MPPGDSLLRPRDQILKDATQPFDELLTNVVPKGMLANTRRRHVGGLLYLARGSRPDVLYAVVQLAKQVTCWTTQSDQQLHRLMQYIFGTQSKILIGEIGT